MKKINMTNSEVIQSLLYASFDATILTSDVIIINIKYRQSDNAYEGWVDGWQNIFKDAQTFAKSRDAIIAWINGIKNSAIDFGKNVERPVMIFLHVIR